MSHRQSSTRIVLARHGEASYADGDLGGVLTELGRSQARAVGDRLRDEGVAAVVCSELSRAQQTAEIAAEVLALPVQTRAGLQEYDIGDERGKPLNRELYERLLMAWLAGAIIATLGSIAPGHTGLPLGDNARPSEQDLPGGASYLLQHSPDGWRIISRMTS